MPAGLCSRVPTRIVLVDDDDLYREVMTGDLEDHGYAVVGFADGPALLAAVQAGLAAEAVLIDWSLPQMSGLDVLRALRAQGSALPVAFLTGRSSHEHADQAIEAGAVDFIDKTCSIDVLVQTLGRLVGLASP
jgi:two-component system response regulator ChvI